MHSLFLNYTANPVFTITYAIFTGMLQRKEIFMKYLIMTVTAGHGHNQTASALYDCILSEGHEAVVLDVLEHINCRLKNSVSKGYLLSTAYSPKAFGKLYRLAENTDNPDGIINMQKIASTLLSRKIVDYINDYAPDYIICTHVIAAMLITGARAETVEAPTAGIITDFTIHPYWDETNLDYYVLPAEGLCYQGMKKGIAKEKLLPFGIPIRKVFGEKLPKNEARAALGLSDKPTVLIMGGSMGYGHVYEILLRLCHMDDDFQIITVCGNNKALKKRIDETVFEKRVLNFGFTDRIPELMDASDFLITKPGGITVSEALAKELPIIMINPIPGQEDRNCEFLLNSGAAMKCTVTSPIDEIMYNLLNIPGRKDYLMDAVRRLKKPHAAKSLIDFLNSGGN